MIVQLIESPVSSKALRHIWEKGDLRVLKPNPLLPLAVTAEALDVPSADGVSWLNEMQWISKDYRQGFSTQT